MKKRIKIIPKFKSEDEEIEFWDKHSFVDYVDWAKAVVNPSLPKLKFSTKAVSMRLPVSLISDLKVVANRKDVPYQSYVKIILAEAVKKEMNL